MLAAGGEEFGAAGIFIDDSMMIVDVAVFGSGADLAPAGAISANRVFAAKNPGGKIEHMHVLLDVEIAG